MSRKTPAQFRPSQALVRLVETLKRDPESAPGLRLVVTLATGLEVVEQQLETALKRIEALETRLNQ